jgi:hypothetical protein
MHKAKEEVCGKKALAICTALKKRNIKGIYVSNCDEAREKVLSFIPRGARIGLGGSHTLRDCGIIRTLREGDYNLIDRYRKGLNKEEVRKLLIEGLSCDVFLSGTNAITQDGKLVNIDGTGNRVAALLYGSGKVIIVTGVNKIVEDVEAAVRRIKLWAAPFNCISLGSNTPCARTGICNELACPKESKSCNEITVIEGQRESDRMIVILIREELGF